MFSSAVEYLFGLNFALPLQRGKLVMMRTRKSALERYSMTPDFPDMLLPSQFFSDRLLVGRASGELALRWAVFADGLNRYWKLAADCSLHRSEEFLEEESWVLAEDGDWPFSFTS